MPDRTCIGCRSSRPQTQLVRFALGPRGATISRTAPGRGAWLCSHACYVTAEKRKAFDRAWKVSVPAQTVRALDDQVRIAFGGDTVRMEEFTTTKG